MKNHSLTTAIVDGLHVGWCECGLKLLSPATHKWEVEDWHLGHVAQVQRARGLLRDRNPSLLDQYRWYKKQAERATDSQERAMWLLLADGLEHRLGHPVEETPLFKVEPVD